MRAIRPGQTWKILLIDEVFIGKVIGAGATFGWWECFDIATGVEASIPEAWFLERLDDVAEEP